MKGIRQLISLKSKDLSKPNKLIKDHQEITDPKLIGNEFNNLFATIGSRLAAEIPSYGTRTHKTYLDNPHISSFFRLNWKKHTHEVGKKRSRGIGILSKLRHFVTSDILNQLHYSLVYPFLTYGLIAWGNTYATTLKPVVVLQKKAVRIIAFSNRDAHSSPLFFTARINQINGSCDYLYCPFHVSVSSSFTT